MPEKFKHCKKFIVKKMNKSANQYENYYANEYVNALNNGLNTFYNKTPQDWENNINRVYKIIMDRLNINDRMLKFHKQQAFT